MGMVLTLVIVVDEDGVARRHGGRPGGLPRAPGPGARRDPGRRPRHVVRATPRSASATAGPGETALIRLTGRGGQAPRVGGAAAAAARLPRRDLVARRRTRPTRRPTRSGRLGPAPDHRCRLRLARQDQGAPRRSAPSTPRATPTWPGPGSRPWRALLAAALDQQPLKVTGCGLRRTDQPERRPADGLAERPAAGPGRALDARPGRGSPRSRWRPREGPIRITRTDGRLATFSSPGQPDRPVALKRRELPRAAGRGAAPARRGRHLRGGRPPAGLADRHAYAAQVPQAAQVTTAHVEVLADPAHLAGHVARRLLALLAQAQAEGGAPQIALTGGDDRRPDPPGGRPALRRLRGRLVAGRRLVGRRAVRGARDSADRNAGQARAALLDVVGGRTRARPRDAVHRRRPRRRGSCRGVLRRRCARHGSGEFDLVLLGMGPDGHVASLFPGLPHLDVDDRIAVGVTGSPKPPPERITLTLPALNRAREVWFLVTGAGEGRGRRPCPRRPGTSGRRPGTSGRRSGTSGSARSRSGLDHLVPGRASGLLASVTRHGRRTGRSAGSPAP